MKGLKELVEVSIRTNERKLEFVAFNGMILIKQHLDEDVTSVVLSKEEVGLVAAMSDNIDNSVISFLNSVAQQKAI